MKSKLIHQNAGERSFILVLEHGDEAMGVITDFARSEELRASKLSGIGAFSEATIAFFERSSKDYKEIPVDEQVEVLSFLGDIAMREGEPVAHVHVTLGRADGSTCGGHLMAARVFPTLEVMVTDAPGALEKSLDEETGLWLIDPGS